MPRCSCPGTSCSCKIESSTTVTVEGVGTLQAPFKLHVDLSGLLLSDRFTIDDSSTVDLVLNGDGTESDPLVLTATVKTGSLAGAEVTNAPASGATIDVAEDVSLLFLDHAATIAALTITLPAGSTALGKEVTVNSRSIVTALTVNADPGATVVGAPTSLAVNGFFRMRLVGTVWRRVG